MITRKDQLLNRPWEQWRFDNHRRKVQSASAAIDNKPPAPRQHVTLKLKKKQQESERIEQIEKNNFHLLRKMNHIRRTSRVDNHWTTPQPNFLNRISLYDTPSRQKSVEILFSNEELYEEENPTSYLSRRQKCVACTPQLTHDIMIPEERIPWEPISRQRSQSVPARKLEVAVHVKPTSKSANVCQPSKTVKQKPVMPKSTQTLEAKKSPQSIILSRGCLKLSVNFPSDTFVKFQEGNKEKVLTQGVCNCKNVPTSITG